MNPFPLRFLRALPPVALAIVAASCAPAPQPPPVVSQPSPATKPAPAKPDHEKRERLKPSERGEVSSISMDKLFELQQSGNVLLYDARPSVLFNAGHIAGAINFPKSIAGDVIKVREPELKSAKTSGKTIVVYCSGPLCSDARTVARLLASHGYSSSVFPGGWEHWKNADLPTE